MGRVEGDAIRCLYHGFLFDADGQCQEIPGQDMIPPRTCFRTYPACEKNDWVWGWMTSRASPHDTSSFSLIV